MSTDEADDLVVVGRITGAHGIRGEIKVEVLTDQPGRFDPGESLLLFPPGGGPREVEIAARRAHKGRYLIRIAGVEDRNGAEDLRGHTFMIREEDLAPLPPGEEYYHFQFVGLQVSTDGGEDLGKIEEVFPTGSNLVFVVRKGRHEVLLPYTDEVVLDVNIDRKEMKVHLIEGLRRRS